MSPGHTSLGFAALVGAAVAMAGPAMGQSDAETVLAGVESLGWVAGSDSAAVVVVEFSDLSCPYCASFHRGTRAALREEFVERGRVRWITVSYVSGLYRHSEVAARGAECAGRQGRYEAFSAAMLARRDSWVGGSATGVETAIRTVVDELALDRAVFRRCLDDPEVRGRLNTVRDIATRAGVRGTPTWFVDGFPVMGDLPTAYARAFLIDRLEPGGELRREPD